jgi:probable HAF family extracellular repeat protein
MSAQSANPLPKFGPIYYLVLAALFLPASFAAAQDYTLTDIGPFAVPVALNSSGQVTGTTTQTGHDSSFFWTRTGGLQILPDLGSGTTDAKAMNDSGAIVGQSGLANHAIHAFLWTQAGGIKDLGSPLGGNSIAYAINPAGEVSGLTFSPDGAIVHAFFWSPSTGAIDLGVSNGNSTSFALGMNGAGEIVGYQFGTTSGFTPFRWTQATGIESLHDFGLPNGFAKAVNDNGEIAGYAAIAEKQTHAVKWSPDGTIQDLGTLSGTMSSNAFFINQSGHVAGYSRPTDCCGKQRTFFWTPAGIVDIGLLPNHQNGRSIPIGFNNRDQIVGSNGGTYLWSPTLGLRQIPGIKVNQLINHALNDAGQILGTRRSNLPAVLASPTMHVNVSSSQNPSNVGQNVTFTANVSSIVGLPPDGEQVTFMDGATVLGTATLGSGSASFSTSSLVKGKHPITANYAGDDNYLPNKSAKLYQVVNP